MRQLWPALLMLAASSSHTHNVPIDCANPAAYDPTELIPDQARFCKVLRNKLTPATNASSPLTVQFNVTLQPDTTAAPHCSYGFNEWWTDGFDLQEDVVWTGQQLVVSLLVMVLTIYLWLFAPPCPPSWALTFGTLWLFAPFAPSRCAEGAGAEGAGAKVAQLEKKIERQTIQVMAGVALIQVGAMATFLALRGDVPKAVNNLTVMLLILIKKPWSYTAQNDAFLRNAASSICVFSAVTFIALRYFGVVPADTPFQAHVKCSLLFYNICQPSNLRFFVANSVLTAFISIAVVLRQDTLEEWQSLRFTLGLSNVLALLIFMVKRMYIRQVTRTCLSPERSHDPHQHWWTAICGAAPLSFCLLFLDNQPDTMQHLLAKTTQQHWNLLAALCVLTAIAVRFPPPALRSHLRLFDVPLDGLNDSEFAIARTTAVARRMGMCQSIVTVAYTSMNGDLGHTIVPLLFAFSFSILEPGVSSMTSTHAVVCMLGLPIGAALSWLRLIDTLSLWPACFGLPFFGVVIHQSLGRHLAEVLCVTAVMLVMGNDGLRFCSVGASLLSCLALCGKLAWQMQVLYFGPGHAPSTLGIHNCSETSDGADKSTSKHTCNTSSLSG